MKLSRGDTIIEVVLAVTIFSMVAVGALTIMNDGLAMAQRSLETTLVRQQIDGQAEMLRYVHSRAKEDPASSYGAIWKSISDSPATAQSLTKLINADSCPESIDNSFSFAQSPTQQVELTTTSAIPPTYAKVNGSVAQGISVQLVRVDGGNAYDAYIQACWDAPGLKRPMTVGTIARLYDTAA